MIDMTEIRKTVYNNLMATEPQFKKDVEHFAKDWFDKHPVDSYSSRDAARTAWSLHVHTGVIDHIIDKYI